MSGKVEEIYIAEEKGGPTIPVDMVHVVPGLGIEGDRYYKLRKSQSLVNKSGQEITLIEIEAVDFLRDVEGLKLLPGQTRRNVVTRGIPLNELVGKTFTIGSVEFRGVRLCEPCQYLADRTDQRILKSMVHHGGLRAEIITDGFIHINDIIVTNE